MYAFNNYKADAKRISYGLHKFTLIYIYRHNNKNRRIVYINSFLPPICRGNLVIIVVVYIQKHIIRGISGYCK